MNDKELADRIVALGVGTAILDDMYGWRYKAPGSHEEIEAIYFVRDWRVAGAMMEKVDSVYLEALVAPMNLPDSWQAQASMDAMPTKWIVHQSSGPRAINEVCVEALDERGHRMECDER